MRVALIPTGRTEWHGLHVALHRLFPEHEFYALPDEIDFSSTGPFDGFTSYTLTERHEGKGLPEQASDLIGFAAEEARSQADLVVVLDDLELANRHQPERVVRVFRRTVERYLGDLPGSRARMEAVLRERVSFHLIVPMIEAWFFGDPQALRAAGVPVDVKPILSATGLEDFHTLDVQYLHASENDCPRWVERGRKKKDRPKWLGDQRERHPKGYLQWLCRDAADKGCTSYDESHGGAEALRRLDWESLLLSTGVRYLGALLEDIADALGESSPMPPSPVTRSPTEASHPTTSRARRPQDHVLRNL